MRGWTSDCDASSPLAGINCRGFDFVVGKEYLVFATARDSETGTRHVRCELVRGYGIA